MFPLNYKNLLNKLDLFFPRKCMSCGFDLKTPGLSYICNQCFDKIIPIEETKGTKCQYCSAFLNESQTNLCYECHTYGRAFTKNTSLFYYQDIIIKELVHLFKFNSVLAAGRELSELINSELNILLKKTNGPDGIRRYFWARSSVAKRSALSALGGLDKRLQKEP